MLRVLEEKYKHTCWWYELCRDENCEGCSQQQVWRQQVWSRHWRLLAWCDPNHRRISSCVIMEKCRPPGEVCLPLRKPPRSDSRSQEKRFPIYHACPKCLAAYRCGLAFPQNGLASLQELEKVGKTQVDWVTWDGPLRTDSASLKSLEIIQTINFIL